jgi:hypothetical protein
VKVAVLGTGTMGAAMARQLLAADLDVTVWNRTRRNAEPLAERRARIADSPAEAVEGADIVMTVLSGRKRWRLSSGRQPGRSGATPSGFRRARSAWRRPSALRVWPTSSESHSSTLPCSERRNLPREVSSSSSPRGPKSLQKICAGVRRDWSEDALAGSAARCDEAQARRQYDLAAVYLAIKP